MRLCDGGTRVVAVALLTGLLASLVSAADDFVLHGGDQATTDQVQTVLRQVAKQYPDILKQAGDVTLLNIHEAVNLRRHHGEPKAVAEAYSREALVGAGNGLMMFGPFESLDAGQYIIVYRLQQLDKVEGKSIRLDVCTDGRTIAERRPGASEFAQGHWSTMPVVLRLTKTAAVEYRFWSNGHSAALDRVYVLRIGATTPRPANSSKSPSGGPTDISVPAAEPSVLSAPTTIPAESNAIERPEYLKKPKPLLKTLTSITSMMVRIGDNGDALGFTSDIIATVDPESRRSNRAGIGMVRADGDETMKAALEEAVRAVKLRYPLWEPGHIDLSFGEKFVAHGGPSAGTAFGILMLSTLEGFEIDPKCAVTGDITVDWKVREVGGVTAKVRGATLDKCLYAAIPVGNEAAFADMALLYGNSSLWDIQAFSIATLQDAVALARSDRPARLAEAIKLFAELQPQLTKAEQTMLKDPQTIQSLKHILELAPNHLSAKHLLAIAEGTATKTLSANGTIYQLSVIFYPYRSILKSRDGIDRHALPAATAIIARKRLAALRLVADKSLLPLVSDIATLIDAIDNLAGGIGSVAAVNNRLDNLKARLATLQSDLGFAEKFAREAY